MSMSFAQSTSLEGGGAFVDAIGGLATIVLAIVALAGVASTTIVAIATIVFGAALLIHGGAVLSEFAHTMYTPGYAAGTGTSTSVAEFGGGTLSALFLAGATGIVLGVLDLLGIASGILAAISLIVFGSALLLSSGSTHSLQKMKSGLQTSDVSRGGNEIVASEMASGSAAAQALAGLAAIVLGILAVTGIRTGVLTMAGLIVVGASILLTGSALAGAAVGFMRPIADMRPRTSAQ